MIANFCHLVYAGDMDPAWGKYRLSDVAEILGVAEDRILSTARYAEIPYRLEESSGQGDREIHAPRDFIRRLGRALETSDLLPLVPVSTIASFLGIPPQLIRKLFKKKGYWIVSTRHLGDCLTFGDALYVSSDIKLLRKVLNRYDRGALLWWIFARENLGPVLAPLFSEGLEQKIKRISRMKQPWKSYAAGDLLEKYMEARSVAEAVPRKRSYTPPSFEPFGSIPSVERIDAEIEKLLKMLPSL